jgi:sulfur-oxidizing protein SoxY
MRLPVLAAILAVTLAAPAARAADEEAARAERWHKLAQAIFDGHEPADLPGWVSIEAPARAADAALVPVTLTLAPDKRIRSLTFVVDENPSPVAARIVFGPAADPRTVTLRVRVDQYSNLHAVVEAADGRLISATRFIKAAGGCSAPAAATPEAALQGIGRMKLRLGPPEDGAMRAELLIRHPNFNGMQMDQLTRLYTPARYIRSVDIAYDGTPVLHMDADISLASDPALGFVFKTDGAGTLSVRAADTADATWHQEFAVAPHGT